MGTENIKSKLANVSMGRSFVAIFALVAVVFGALAINAGTASAQEPPARDFFATVLWVEDPVLALVTRDGVELEVTTTDDTVIRLPLKRDATIDDVAEGDVVAVSLVNGEGNVVDKIFVVPGKTRHKHIVGEAIEVSDDHLAVDPFGRGSDPIEFNITDETNIVFRRGATELFEGSFVIVLAVRDAISGELSPDAIEINVSPPLPRVKPDKPKPPKERDTQSIAKLRGVFEEITDDDNWIVGGTTVVIDVDTEIESGLVIGQLLEVSGELLDDGSILAHEVEAKEDKPDVVKRTVFEGAFDGLDGDNWIVSGTVVIVKRGIDTDGIPEIGQIVKVKAIVLGNGSILAREIENVEPSDDDDDTPDRIKLEGTFQGIDDNGNWLVNGLVISVDEDTELEGTPEEGNHVEVVAILLEDGTILARKIEVESQRDENAKTRHEVELTGTIDRILEEERTILVLSSRLRTFRVIITELTEVEGELVIGDIARVKALIGENRILIAKTVQVRVPGDDDGDSKLVEIRGVIKRVQHINTDRIVLQVNGVTILIGARTRLIGEPVIGAAVRIEGEFGESGEVFASRVRVFTPKGLKDRIETEIKGYIDSVEFGDNGRIVSVVVGDNLIKVETLTELEGHIEVGVYVKVKGILSDNGLIAREIEEEGDDEDESDDDSPGVSSSRAKVKFEGTIEKISRTDTEIVVVVNGREVVIIIGRTDLEGTPELGLIVEVEGIVRGNVIVASEFEVEGFEDEDTDDDEDVNGSDIDDDEDSDDNSHNDDADVDDDGDDLDEDGDSKVKIKGDEVKIEGRITRREVAFDLLTETIWVEGFEIRVIRGETEVETALREGQFVEVEGVLVDGVVIAEEVEVDQSRGRRSAGSNSIGY